ncbi:uncharacterized protein FOMMEDRAFT_111707 [Fomitiporia mediterranea MF3/22]|uniref:uncharacterized protein n=1 Tax=Fomitiporia mediterranea (strain MF3/22) TaxID=694068 RepID=UPI000440754D|nr:uncharacterized protein FOMMEDRAFT_111707 [Fomitiporia mediterranea MF3/22]EJD01692.1 hypothetical protein FOMMEDRAFT_111707 [Fomitiporia mediterranea MF3/22]
MSSSEFTFIPRKLSKHTRTSNDASGLRLPAQRKETQVEQVPSTPASGRKHKEEKYLDDGTYTVLLELALSDYALWSNFELFETMEANEDGSI